MRMLIFENEPIIELLACNKSTTRVKKFRSVLGYFWSHVKAIVRMSGFEIFSQCNINDYCMYIVFPNSTARIFLCL